MSMPRMRALGETRTGSDRIAVSRRAVARAVPTGERYFTRTFLRRNVGTSRSWPSTIVGSLFSKRPRVTDSNCSTSCFACTIFSSGGFDLLRRDVAGFFFEAG